MNARKMYAWTICLMLSAVLLATCATEAPPETRAGEWRANTKCGDFTLNVNEAGTAVNGLRISSKYKDLENVNLVVGNTAIKVNAPGKLEASVNSQGFQPHPIEGNNLSMNLGMANMGIVSLDAAFSTDNGKLSGTVHFYPQEQDGGCKTKFTINR